MPEEDKKEKKRVSTGEIIAYGFVGLSIVIVVLFIVLSDKAPAAAVNITSNMTGNNSTAAPAQDPGQESGGFSWGWILASVIITGVVGYLLHRHFAQGPTLNLVAAHRPAFPAKEIRKIWVRKLLEENKLCGTIFPDGRLRYNENDLFFGSSKTTKMKDGLHWLLQRVDYKTVQPVGTHILFAPMLNAQEILDENVDIAYNGEILDHDLNLRKFPKHLPQSSKERILESQIANASRLDPTSDEGMRVFQQLSSAINSMDEEEKEGEKK